MLRRLVPPQRASNSVLFRISPLRISLCQRDSSNMSMIPSDPRRQNPQQKKIVKEAHLAEKAVIKRLQAFVPKFRLPPAPAPTTHYESWVPAWHVSPDAKDNVLNFRTRYYLGAAGTQPPGHSKVELIVNVLRLGLGELEMKRLIDVAGSKYDHSKTELKLVSNAFPERHRNKADIRKTLNALLEDARVNADSHSETPDEDLPLAARRGRMRWPPIQGLKRG